MDLNKFLADRQIPFEQFHHHPAYTAKEVAEGLHVPGQEIAKSVLLRVPKGSVLAVLPATHSVDLAEMGRDLGAAEVEMASEQEIEQIFPDCERGAMPPFGSLYRLPTIVDETLTEDERIVFDAQSHQDAIRMAFRDYAALEHPRIGHFAHRN